MNCSTHRKRSSVIPTYANKRTVVSPEQFLLCEICMTGSMQCSSLHSLHVYLNKFCALHDVTHEVSVLTQSSCPSACLSTPFQCRAEENHRKCAKLSGSSPFRSCTTRACTVASACVSLLVYSTCIHLYLYTSLLVYISTCIRHLSFSLQPAVDQLATHLQIRIHRHRSCVYTNAQCPRDIWVYGCVLVQPSSWILQIKRAREKHFVRWILESTHEVPCKMDDVRGMSSLIDDATNVKGASSQVDDAFDQKRVGREEK